MIDNIKIYALSNPEDKSVFYVGATSGTLKERLAGHLSTKRTDCISGYIKDRISFINNLVENGNIPEILLLKEVPLEETNYYEEFYYKSYLEKGSILIQDPTKFNYFKDRSNNSDEESIKLPSRWKESMYNQIKNYAEDNGMTFMGALRFIVSQFFKNKI